MWRWTAALTAWKQAASPGPSPLGKPLEAVIALFNPDMVREWRVLHEAELHLDLDPAGGIPRGFAIVPGEDGTAAAAIRADLDEAKIRALPLLEPSAAT